MLGNDIVDLRLAGIQSDWQRRGFLEKLFIREEQNYIRRAEDPFMAVWKLWSMKEAAYKLYTRMYPRRFFNPRAFECKAGNKRGEVFYNGLKCHTNTRITEEYILSNASLNENEIVSEVVEMENEDPTGSSQFLKETAIAFAKVKFNINSQDLCIKKTAFGIPSLVFEKREISLSLTHHGRYGAFAMA